MKRAIKGIILLLFFVTWMPVFAISHDVGDLIPISESATIETELFTYNEITYSPEVPGKDYGIFRFASVVNKSSKQVPVSIDLLLFDSNKLNIGMVAYCSSEDISSDYAQKKLGAGASSSFAINAVTRYFVSDKTPKDVSYYAVLDDNPYCHVGGYEKYEGMTIDEILGGGKIPIETQDGKTVNVDVDALLGGLPIMIVLVVLILVVGSCIVQGLVLNALYKKMYGKTTSLAYLPVFGNYIAVKLAFGQNVAKIYVICYIVSLGSFVIKLLSILSVLLNFVSSVAFIMVIIRLITKKYSLENLDSSSDNEEVDPETNYTVSGEMKSEDTMIEEVNSDPVIKAANEEINRGQDILDLSYPDESFSSQSNSMEESNSSGMSASLDDSGDQNSTESGTNTSNVNNNEGESALMDLFK